MEVKGCGDVEGGKEKGEEWGQRGGGHDVRVDQEERSVVYGTLES